MSSTHLADVPASQALELSEVAEHLGGIPHHAAARLVRKGLLRGFQLAPGGKWYVTASDLAAYCEARGIRR